MGTLFAGMFVGRHVLGAGSEGKMLVWEIDPMLDASFWESAGGDCKPNPKFVHKLHDCAIFCMLSLSNDVILTGSDDGIRAWKADSLLSQNAALLHSFAQPQIRIARGATLPVAETNGLARNTSGSTFISAAGDSKAYAWDSATFKIKATFEGHEKYLHCVQCKDENLFVTGAEDGKVMLWDLRDARKAGELLPCSGEAKHFVASVDIEKNNWVAAGGGSRCVWLWHLGSRKMVAAMPSCGDVQAVTFCGDKIISAGAEPAMYIWSRSGTLASRVKTDEPSMYSIAHRPIDLQSSPDSLDSRIVATFGTQDSVSIHYRGGADFGFKLSTHIG